MHYHRDERIDCVDDIVYVVGASMKKSVVVYHKRIVKNSVYLDWHQLLH